MIEFHELPETASTNLYVSENLQEFADGNHVVFTQKQTAGRGMGSNTWESEAGKNITFSIVCHPTSIKPAEQFILSMAIAVSVVDQLVEGFPEEAQHFKAKWPNDIYWKDRKLGGILIENRLKGSLLETCILGIGLNINQKHFLSDAPNPVSLTNITGKEHDGTALMKRICERFIGVLQENRFAAIREEYHNLLFRYDGKPHTFEDVNGQFSATIVKVHNNGRLQLRTEKAEDCYYWLKEVQFIL